MYVIVIRKLLEAPSPGETKAARLRTGEVEPDVMGISLGTPVRGTVGGGDAPLVFAQ